MTVNTWCGRRRKTAPWFTAGKNPLEMPGSEPRYGSCPCFPWILSSESGRPWIVAVHRAGDKLEVYALRHARPVGRVLPHNVALGQCVRTRSEAKSAQECIPCLRATTACPPTYDPSRQEQGGRDTAPARCGGPAPSRTLGCLSAGGSGCGGCIGREQKGGIYESRRRILERLEFKPRNRQGHHGDLAHGRRGNGIRSDISIRVLQSRGAVEPYWRQGGDRAANYSAGQ